MQIVDRGIIQATADIMGERSAVAMVLEEAKLYNNPVFIKIDNTLIVTSKNKIDDLMEMMEDKGI